jgi:hypothetical protein
MKKFNPLLKTRRVYTVNIASRADSGQWQFSSAKMLLSTKHAWNKEGVAGSQKWLLYHLPKGYSGVTGVQRQRQNKSNRTLGNSPRRWRRAYINITHATLSRAGSFPAVTVPRTLRYVPRGAVSYRAVRYRTARYATRGETTPRTAYRKRAET